MTSKEGCIRWRVFWNLPENRIGQPIFRDIIYISWDNIAVYPKTTSYKPTQIPKSASGTIVYQEGELIWRMAVTQGEVIYAIVSGGDFASC